MVFWRVSKISLKPSKCWWQCLLPQHLQITNDILFAPHARSQLSPNLYIQLQAGWGLHTHHTNTNLLQQQTCIMWGCTATNRQTRTLYTSSKQTLPSVFNNLEGLSYLSLVRSQLQYWYVCVSMSPHIKVKLRYLKFRQIYTYTHVHSHTHEHTLSYTFTYRSNQNLYDSDLLQSRY